MNIAINHFSIRTTDLHATQQFYEQVLSLTVGPRPEFPFPGVWMYRGDHGDIANAVVHVIGIDPSDRAGLANYLGDRNISTLHGTGCIDHVAFSATGLDVMLKHLAHLDIEVRERTVSSLGLHQLFLDDPNGVVVELNYPASEKRSAAT